MPGRTIAIGDIHGCSAALAALLDAIEPGPNDTVVTLGDYIDRGPDSRGVIEQLIALGQRCRLIALMGNHEEMLLGALGDQGMLRGWLSCGGVEMLASYGFRPTGEARRFLGDLLPREHWAFLTRLRGYHETDSHLFVHAGYHPHLPMDQQPAEALRWQFTERHWAKAHFSGKIAIVGHTPQRTGEVLDLGFLKCIDTHCHAGKWLTALEVPSGKTWQASPQGELRSGPGRHEE